jgi:hypothetical protein
VHEPELLGELGEAPVVAATPAGGVVDVAHVGQGVGRFVEQSAEHDDRSPAQPLPAHEDLVALIVALPAHRGEVPTAQVLPGT